jgi:hypothetical protein
MEEFAHHPDAAGRSISYVGPDEVVALNPAVCGEVAGGLHCAADAVVEPSAISRQGPTRAHDRATLSTAPHTDLMEDLSELLGVLTRR